MCSRVRNGSRGWVAVLARELHTKRAMAEMRWIVGRLRDDDPDSPPELSSRPRLVDIGQLATATTLPTLQVDATMCGDLGNLEPSVETTAFRLAQESVTNAIRHAANATCVSISVTGEAGAAPREPDDEAGRPEPHRDSNVGLRNQPDAPLSGRRSVSDHGRVAVMGMRSTARRSSAR